MVAANSSIAKLWTAIYTAHRLPRCQLCEETIAMQQPHVILMQWLADAQRYAPYSRPRIGCLATVDRAGHPMTRLTAIEQISDEGLTFFTSLGSRQAGDILHNPHVSLQFHWPRLSRGVCIIGTAVRLPQSKALLQFHRYPYHVQLQICAGRRRVYDTASARAAGKLSRIYDILSGHLSNLFGLQKRNVSMPANWGGFLIKPMSYEFGEVRGIRPEMDGLRFYRGTKLTGSIQTRSTNGDQNGWIYDNRPEIASDELIAK